MSLLHRAGAADLPGVVARATGWTVLTVASMLAGCGVANVSADREPLEPLHGAIDPESLSRPQEAPAPVPDVPSAGARWRVASIVDGRTLELYQGLERATAVLGEIDVPVDDECFAEQAAATLAFITGGGQSVEVIPSTPQRSRIDDARIVNAAGDDLAEVLLALGLAQVAPGSGRPIYDAAEADARQAGVGIWSDECDDS